jgi:hypothetical protein
MHVYDAFLPRMIVMIENLGRWIDAAEAGGHDLPALLEARLAPDMYTFTQQIQAACDTAKYAAARLSGREAPSHPDTEKTVAEVRARIASVLEYLRGFAPADFDGYEERFAQPRWLGGKRMSAEDYVFEFAIPNFYFHAATAYDILRAKGVTLGKILYIGPMRILD